MLVQNAPTVHLNNILGDKSMQGYKDRLKSRSVSTQNLYFFFFLTNEIINNLICFSFLLILQVSLFTLSHFLPPAMQCSLQTLHLFLHLPVLSREVWMLMHFQVFILSFQWDSVDVIIGIPRFIWPFKGASYYWKHSNHRSGRGRVNIAITIQHISFSFLLFSLHLLNSLYLDPYVFLTFALLILSPIPLGHSWVSDWWVQMLSGVSSPQEQKSADSIVLKLPRWDDINSVVPTEFGIADILNHLVCYLWLISLTLKKSTQ